MSAPGQWNPSQATPYNPYANINLGTSDPRKINANTQGVAADQYGNANQYATAVQDYLGNIVNPIAQGQGGYSPTEASQIEMSPEQQQNMVASSAIAAGTPTQAAAEAAQRAADAAGGNPAAVAAYRARAANQSGAAAGNAATNAEVGAQQALSGEAANVGQTRLGQQGQALNYLSGLQSEQNQNAQNAANRQVQGAGIGLQASQTPSTFDKVMGGIGGGLTALLDEGAPAGSQPSYRAMGGQLPGIPPTGNPPADRFLDGGRTAIVAEKDPEAVVKMNYMDDGGDFGGLDMSQPNPGMDGSISESISPMGSQQAPSFLQQLSSKFGQQHQQPQQQSMGQQPKSQLAGSGASNLGKSIGALGSMFLDDGSAVTDHLKDMIQPVSPVKNSMDNGMPGMSPYMNTKELAHGARQDRAQKEIDRTGVNPGPAYQTPTRTYNDDGAMGDSKGAIFTKPTKLSLEPDEAVVPLSYRANAKARPSMAMPVVDKIQSRYKGLAHGKAGMEKQKLPQV